MKQFFYVILLIIFISLFLKACIKADVHSDDIVKQDVVRTKTTFNFPTESKNIILFGTDYLQSQAPVGNFGGELILSTIGEGPKTFNPFTSKDATSSNMSAMMFDGLFSVSPKDGKTRLL